MFSPRMKLKAAATFSRRFGTGIRAGVDLLLLLRSETKYGPNGQRAAMQALVDGAKNGEALNVVMAKQKPFFPGLMISMVKTGEVTGRLERTLFSLADHYDQQVKLRQSFIQSIAWPVLQLTMGIGVVSLLIWLMGILTPPGGGEMTDLLGLGLKGVSGVLKFWAVLALFFGIIAAVVWAFMRNIGGIQNTIPLLYMVPVFGKSLQTITLAKFAWTLSLALDAGLDPISSISLSLDSTDSDYYRSGEKTAEQAIRGGATLSDGLKATEIFPDEFLSQVDIAELSGTDSESIGRLAHDYSERAERAIKTIAGIFSLLIWLFVIGFMIFMIARIAMVILGGYAAAFEPI